MMHDPNSPKPQVLFFSRDIFFAATVKSAALSAGCDFSIVGSMEPPANIDVTQVRACVVDLTPLGLEQIESLGKMLAQKYPDARRIAFGPHVQTEHFAAASAAGFGNVLAKGQVASLLGKLIVNER